MRNVLKSQRMIFGKDPEYNFKSDVLLIVLPN